MAQEGGQMNNLMRQTVHPMVFAALTVLASNAAAQTNKGTDNSASAMYFGCKAFVEDQPTAEANFCSGVVHALGFVGRLLPPQLQACVPPDSTARQLAWVVVKYMDAHPQRMHEDFKLLTLEAFHDAWPCVR
jgi:hypothetical protein